MPSTASSIPHSPIDLFGEGARQDPYPAYKELTALGPVVCLPNVRPGGVWAITRYHEVRTALTDPRTFSSVQGVGLTEQANATLLPGTVLGSDDPEHTRLRKPLSRQLRSSAIRKLSQTVESRAAALVDQYVAQEQFDAAELSRHLVADVVMDLMGLPEQARGQLISGAAAVFDCLGPANARYRDSAPAASAMMTFLATRVTRHTVRPGSWISALYAAADAGQITEADVVPLMSAYTVAGMDTTILGITAAIAEVAGDPAALTFLRTHPHPAQAAEALFHEALRLRAPIKAFGRRVTRTTTLGGAQLHSGQQVLLLYGATGRDRRKWGPDADTFVPERPCAADHLSLGAGPHTCAGNHLALLQGRSLLTALAARCTHLALDGHPRLLDNNMLYGWQHLPVTVTPD